MADHGVGPDSPVTDATRSPPLRWFWLIVLLGSMALLVTYPLALMAILFFPSASPFLSDLGHACLITGASVPSNLSWVIFPQVRRSEDRFTVALSLASIPVAFVSVWNVLALYFDLGMEPVRVFSGYVVRPTQFVWIYLVLGAVAYGVAVNVGWTYKGDRPPKAESS